MLNGSKHCIRTYKQRLTSNYRSKPRERRALGLLEAIARRSSGHQHRHQRPKPPQQYLDTDISGQSHQDNPGRPWRLAQRPGGPNGKHQTRPTQAFVVVKSRRRALANATAPSRHGRPSGLASTSTVTPTSPTRQRASSRRSARSTTTSTHPHT